MPAFPRSFVYEDRAHEAIEAAKETWNVEDVVNAIEWVIAYDPTHGELLNESGLRGFVYPGAKSINEPDVDVLYEDRDPTVVIHDLTFREPRAYRAGHA